MICRLCLCELLDFVSIFEDCNLREDSLVAKKITKFFNIEILVNDVVSNKICKSCWTHLDEFYKFCLLIEEKQHSLMKDFENIGCIDHDEASKPEKTTLQEDIKNVMLSDPHIDGIINEQPSFKVQELMNVATDSSGNGGLIMKRESVGDVEQASKRVQKNCNQRKVCSNGFKRSCRLRLDRAQRFDKKVRKGTKPKITYNTSATMMEHDAFIAEHATLSCCICKKILENFAELKLHFRMEHKCNGYMMCCNNRYTKRTPYVDHLKQHNNPELFKCKECDKVLANRNSYQNHIYNYHPPEEALKFQCSFCAKKFAKQYILDYHINTHQQVEKKHKCEVCQKGYRSVNEMKQHQKRVHFTTFKVICDICGKHFKSNQSFQKHSEVLHQATVRPEAECKVCGRWLKDDRSLYKHMYKHRDENSGKEFVCSKCGVVKPTRQTLNSHIRYHHPAKLHKCSLCEKEFKRILTLEEHLATHTGQALYTCGFCPQTFKSHANLHKHKKKVHPNEWVRKYSQPSQLISQGSQND